MTRSASLLVRKGNASRTPFGPQVAGKTSSASRLVRDARGCLADDMLRESTVWRIHFESKLIQMALSSRRLSLIYYSSKRICLATCTIVSNFSLFSLFWKNKSMPMRSACCLCVCVSPLSTVDCLNQSLWNLVYISWHLSPSQRRTS
jgi:hypothetical protein